MKLQNILFPPSEGCERELYIRTSAVPCKRAPSLILEGETIRTDTYMNAFDVGAWKKYTDIAELSLAWKLTGNGVLKIYWKKEGMEAVCLAERPVGNYPYALHKGKYELEEFEKLSDGLLYIEFHASTPALLEAWYETASLGQKRIRISLIICTYKRQQQLERLIEVLRSREEDSDWFHTLIIDNASELEEQLYGKGITVYHNVNNGGSGGFTRGMEETIKNLHEFRATHVLLMDDDVILQMESLYRLRALLTFMKTEYEEESVAGRMFRLDRRNVQYTAAEIWNKGDLRHIGWNCDMTLPENVEHMNDNRNAEYGGWWFCCYPIGFVRRNKPLPFFLHCDDVEYGLRHGGTPVILNGIQVWHETYEYRQTPVITYYDCRNSLVVNSIYGDKSVVDAQIQQCMNRIREARAGQDYILEYFLIRACRDYLKGRDWFMRKNNPAIHAFLVRKVKANRYVNYIRRKWLERIIDSYRSDRI